MSFKPLTEKIISFIKRGQSLIEQISNKDNTSFSTKIYNYPDEINLWQTHIINELLQNGEELSSIKIENFGFLNTGLTVFPVNSNMFSEHIKTINNELIIITEKIKERQEEKTIRIITIDEIDNFKELLAKSNNQTIEKKFYDSAFLEDDVENAFLEVLNEPYKEQDSGSEMRDLYTSNIIVDGKRVQTAIMFKGRGVRKTLNISDCGKNGNQLLKLAKNTTAQLYIVQHVNKIESEVIESLKHSLLALSQVNELMICAIDGKDTARFLLGAGKNLETLLKKTR